MAVAAKIFWALIGVLVAIAYGLSLNGIIRKIMARIQGRIGPPIYQPFIDLFKTAFLRTSISHGVMFYLAPVFRAAGGIGLYLTIPVIVGIPALENFSGWTGDLMIAMYFMFFGSLGMAMGAAEGGQPNSPIGISRGLSQMTAYELPFILAVLAIVAKTGSFSLFAIVKAQQGGFLSWNLFATPFAAAAGFLSLLGMNMYAPFNIVGAPQEIPVGPRTEFHSTYLSLIFSGRAVFAVAKAILFMNLFLGGATGAVDLVLKTFLIYFWSVFVGAVNPRFRTEQSIGFFLKWPLVAGLAAVIFAMVR